MDGLNPWPGGGELPYESVDSTHSAFPFDELPLASKFVLFTWN
jgi:hypothetical protein